MVCQFSLNNLNKHRSTMFAGKLAFLNKAHIDIKGQTEAGRVALAKKVRSAVDKHLGSQYALFTSAITRPLIALQSGQESYARIRQQSSAAEQSG